MSMLKCLSSVALLCAFTFTAAQQSPGLGEPVDSATLENVDYTILPDGNGLPEGAGTAVDGAATYQLHCIACHGEGATGAVNEALVGGQGTLATDRPKKTVGSFWPYATTVFDYIRRAMPLQSPGSLSNDEIYAVTAYVLFLNDIVEEDEVINAETLPIVRMPNRDGFSWEYSR